jgi:hypothetical protein
MNHAFIRPRHEGFNRFQEKAADFIHENTLANLPAIGAIQKLNVIYQTICNEHV